MSPPNSLEIVALFAWAASFLFAPEVADIVGPYTAIFLGAALGAGFRLGQIRTKNKWHGARVLAKGLGIALLATVSAAHAIQKFSPVAVEFEWLLVPVAALLAFAGDLVFMWAMQKLGISSDNAKPGDGHARDADQ